MPFTPNETPSSAVNGQDTAFPIPEYEDWDWEIEMDPYPTGRLREINGQLIYMFDHDYGQYIISQEEEKKEEEKKEEKEKRRRKEGRTVASFEV